MSPVAKSKPDPYVELGVERDASDKEIAAAARRHAKANHPDVSGDRERFEAGRRALAVLKDPKKRDKFDRTGVVDEEAVDNDMQKAMEIIITEFAAVINNYLANENPDFDPRRINIFERMKFSLGKKLSDGEASVKKAERQLGFLRDVAGRISMKKIEGKPETDFVKRALEDQIRDYELKIEQAKEAQRRHRTAIDFLSIYNFRYDAPAVYGMIIGV
jgi:curved DNA-binding protein CbpA